ncbi:MAG: proteasome assembly chaperone family protein [Candidatus Heimdallarchaeota archaeon]|nr:MAG: proteasome assembly chaperone family protein [Candidatus Heimdallarchaeota archaeon]
MEQDSSELIMRSFDPSRTVCECSTDIAPEWIVVGFPGHGLVGNIAAKHMIKELDLEWIGSIRSPLIPPVSVFIDGVLAYPYRIYGSKDRKLVILIGESPCPPQAYYYLAHAMLEWAMKTGTKQVICLDGFVAGSREEAPDKVYLVAEPQVYEENPELVKFDFPKPHTGFISGLSGAIMNEALLTPLEGFTFLVSVTTPYPDPGGAAKLIEAVNKVKNLDIDTRKLLQDAEKIQKSMMELSERNRLLSQGEGIGPSKGLYV